MKRDTFVKLITQHDKDIYNNAKQQTLKYVLEILKRFKDDSIYSGRIVKFEIENRLKEFGVEK